MSDGVLIAFFSLIGIVVAATPGTIGALTTRKIALQTRDHAAAAANAATETASALGSKNGNDLDAMQMLAGLLTGQEQQAEQQAELVKLSDYTHRGVHRLNGQVGMMWRQFAIDHGVDPADLPPPEPSPGEPA